MLVSCGSPFSKLCSYTQVTVSGEPFKKGARNLLRALAASHASLKSGFCFILYIDRLPCFYYMQNGGTKALFCFKNAK